MYDLTQAPAIAAAFAALLYRDLTPVQWAEMRVRNITADAIVCHSHDYTDSNMQMAEAFEVVTGREPVGLWETHFDATLGRHVADDPAEEARAMADSALWNAAWAIAAAEYLTERSTIDDLTEEYGEFLTREGLEEVDAMELLMGDLTSEQRAWVSRFVARWDALEDARYQTARL